MSLYLDYVREHKIKEIIEKPWGFATYAIRGEECYIEDIYVTPEERRGSKASELADEVVKIAKASRCKYLSGSVNPISADPTRSIKVLFGYGFKFLRSEPGILWFVKDIWAE